MHNDELPHEVILAIQRVLEVRADDAEGDPFDALTLSTPFSPIPVLNDLFPDEASLAHLDTVSARLAETQRELQTEIDALQAELRRSQDPERMQLIQEMISDLLGQMSRIREKATESEAVVRNITKDIQVLDTAKKNLILSMTTLKRLQMLVNALTQLEDLVREKKYNEISETLAAVKQISATFKPYTAVQRVAQVWKRIQEIQGDLRNKIDADFDAFILQDTSKAIKAPQITDACLVVDVLGADFRGHLIDRYVALEVKEYRRIFRATDEAGQLDNLSRRFAWFRRMLQTHEVEQGRVFPAEWRVGWCLLAKFVDITRDDVTMLLAKAGPSLTVKALLENLQITTEFEVAMSKKWATNIQAMLDATTGVHAAPIKPISAAFEPHMSIFVDAQDKVLADMLAPHRRSKAGKAPPRPSLDAPGAEPDSTDDAPILVLPSSTDLFYFYAQSLEQCAKLSTGQALFDLCALHKKWLRIYAEDVLIASLKRSPSQPQSRRSNDARFDPHELKHACILINTADYCLTTALELEEKIREKINEDFRERVSLQPERDMFVSVISAAIIIQLRELESACDAAFATMARTTWTATNQVSGQSAYAGDLVSAAEQVIEIVKPLVEQKKYLRNLFDKACSLILAKFTGAIVKSRPLKEIGAEQLLIDLQQVKGYLSRMPGEALMTASYTRGLTKSTTRLEALLKVIVTPVDPPEGFILNYTLLIGDASFSNFQKILDLKGTPKAQQNALLDDFLTITSTKTDLDSTSFLSSLDMEPPGPGQLGGSLVSPGGSRVSLPLAVNGEGIFATMTSPASTGPGGMSSSVSFQGAGSGTETPTRGGERREVFSDFRRFVSFGLRKDSMAPS
ncbi:Vps53-like protein [Lyophyllum atratum]|nr:Vps53-like protein [Lyophyllum atratum]